MVTDLQRRVVQLLAELGGRDTGLSGYEYELDTKAGTLYIHVYEDWIATRFDQPQLALMEFGQYPGGIRINENSGKWNWMLHSLLARGFDAFADALYEMVERWI